MDFSRKSLTISIVMSILLFLSISASPIINPLISSFIIAFIYYFLLYWLLDFDVVTSAFVTVLLLSTYYIQSFSLFILTLAKLNESFLILVYLSIILFFIIIQVINRISNVTNVSTIKKIPLFQVTQSFNYVFSVISLPIGYLSLQLLNIQFLTVFGYMLLSVIIVFFSNLWMFDEKDKRALISYAMISVLYSSVFFIMISFLDIKPLFRSVIMTIFLFIFLGFNYLFSKQAKVGRWYYIQLLLLFILMLGIVYLPLILTI